MLTICDPDAVVDPDYPVQNCEPMVLATGEAITFTDHGIQDGDSIGPSMISAQLSCKSCCLLSPTTGESGMQPGLKELMSNILFQGSLYHLYQGSIDRIPNHTLGAMPL